MDPSPVGPAKDPGAQPHRPVAAAQRSASACYSHSEEFLSRVSCDLTNEALSGARCPPTPMPPKEPQRRDQGTQMSRHVLPVTQTRGTDTRSDKNRTRNKSHLLPPRDMGEDFMNEEGKTLIPRGKDFSQHKQVEAVRQEETMRGVFLTDHRPPRRAPGAPGGLSPLVSKRELGNVKPLGRSHSLPRAPDTPILSSGMTSGCQRPPKAPC
ncbi:uncharacterized protein LOC119942764 isoform X1 [Tachyglossus aculeatus]|uniref:uncharacterized protein LOC119942764 isoform X1 n=1 Tax=Tachyglossus aculeatus TaxID=9261 RepID=UPI0018F34C0A|nr:uncharacterized protein LOC119942764 isoform X1 [Tachyglossus aculeatus]XP_038619623.1 uncharacterized protein LOC119942764 isoform X1 [Tachyglossus aculeatus]